MRFRVLRQLTGSLLLQEIRSFQSLFWMLMFPVFLLLLFGLIFGQEGFRKGSLVIGVDKQVNDLEGIDLRWMPDDRQDEMVMVWYDYDEGIDALERGFIYAFITHREDVEEYTVIITGKCRLCMGLYLW